MMKRLATLLSLMAVAIIAVTAQVGTWKAYTSYYEPQNIVKVDHYLFVQASNGLYKYNIDDESITTYDKVRQLNDSRIIDIAWNAVAKRLIIVYDNCNIDLMDTDDNVVNISALFTKVMTQDKGVNSIFINEQYAYLATTFGVVKVNMQRVEISETYILNENIKSVGISDGTLYVINSSGKVMAGDMSKNLIDPHNWSTATAPANVFNVDKTDWDENIALVRTLQPGGPKYNYFGHVQFQNGKLYTSNGYQGSTTPGCIQVLENGEWTIYEDNLQTKTGITYCDVYSLAIDPNDPDHVFGGARTGLYEFRNGAFVNFYNQDNSPIETARYPTSSNQRNYNLVTSTRFDTDGNLWLLVSQASTHGILKLSADGEWAAMELPELVNCDTRDSRTGIRTPANMNGLVQDSRGLFWFSNSSYLTPSFYRYDPNTNDLTVYMSSGSPRSYTNQDGTSVPVRYGITNITEDLKGNMWIPTSGGPLLIEADRVYEDGSTYMTQVKVPRNDGTNYADYLLNDVNISCMAVDGGNRKWFGTSGSGIYVISDDNMVQEFQFNTTNSPLLSDNVQSICIDEKTGEVFIGTENGLCSYMSDASTAAIEMVKDDVYAYPNPVVRDYDGLITIVGLSFDADVKILTTNGQLVAEGRSKGGTFTWNGRDRQGRRVASGIYMVAAATSDGKKGTVCKIAVVR